MTIALFLDMSHAPIGPAANRLTRMRTLATFHSPAASMIDSIDQETRP